MKFTMSYTAGDDEKKIRDYLFMLNEQLRYMFSNLDPEENFSESSNYIKNDKSFSIIENAAEKISWIISDGESESDFSLSSEAVELLSDEVKIEGLVKFSDLETAGSTVINGANIKTGTISADMIKGGTLAGTTLSGATITGTVINGAKIKGTTITAGTITGNYYSGGVLDIANRLYADEKRTRIGDFFCSFNQAYHLQDIKYTFIVDAGEVTCISMTSTYSGETYSDERLKENIETIPTKTAKEFIESLRPVLYYRTDTKEEGIGFIAQEVKTLLEEKELEWALTGEHRGYLTIAYESFIPLITAAIQEAYEENNI